MANPFYHYAKAEITPIVKPLGFCCYNRHYYRIINDVVQQFSLLWLSRQFTIRFWISSVYQENDRRTEGEEIYQLIDGSNRWLGENTIRIAPNYSVFDERFRDLTPARYQEFASITADAFQTYLLPWFNRASTPETAYQMRNEVWNRAFERDNKSILNLGFLLSLHEWERAASLLKRCIDNSKSPWWNKHETEYVALYNALIQNNSVFISNYMERKRKETYLEFKWRPNLSTQ